MRGCGRCWTPRMRRVWSSKTQSWPGPRPPRRSTKKRKSQFDLNPNEKCLKAMTSWTFRMKLGSWVTATLYFQTMFSHSLEILMARGCESEVCFCETSGVVRQAMKLRLFFRYGDFELKSWRQPVIRMLMRHGK